MTNLLRDLEAAGQAIWLDYVDRTFLKEGGLRRLIEEDGLTGVTSNPSIFEKAIGHGDAYDAGLAAFVSDHSDATVTECFESLAIADIRAAADDLRPVYDRLDGRDGYVSLEVSPYLAHDTDATIAEARRLWRAVDRPNLMIKVPGTAAGVPAIRTLIEEGLNINVTLLFALDAYKAVAEAFLAGIEARVAKGQDIARSASVASFFVSRIDTMIDKAIDARLAQGDAQADALKAVRGKVAIANARQAYQHYLDLIGSPRWKALAAKGAMPQRLLWASTGTKDPAYSDVLYVETLIGPDTVNTMPLNTMDAFRDHGRVAETLTADPEEARRLLAEAAALGIDLDRVTAQLVEDGVVLFADAADALLGAVAGKRAALAGDSLNGMREDLPEALRKAVDERLEQARAQGWSRRLWRGDATLWTGKDEGEWLGWIAAAEGRQVDMAALAALGEEARQYRDAVLLGMGGSSLGPEVIGRILGPAPGHPPLHVLDTTDPGQIGTVAAAIDPARTLFLVSSKSGSTMEPELLRTYFYDLAGKDGSHFIAVTDPGSALEKVAKADGFAHVFAGDPAIGGRYSVLSVFGMVPAAILGVDVPALFRATAPMVRACGPDVPPAANPGVRLGAIIGEAANAGRDKLTILTGENLRPFGAWLEQLLAESTGKQGKGVIPVDLEPPGTPDHYGSDRLFVHLALSTEHDAAMEKTLDALAAAGHPVVRIRLARKELIGQEFFRWEVATAIAGAVIGIDPFDQPDVEDAKVRTRELVDAYEASGKLQPETPLFEDDGLAVYGAGDGDTRLADAGLLIGRHFATLRPGDYLGFLAYIERDEAHEAAIARMRTIVRDARAVATVAGFGPRFLHSTGQAYKGGPNSGVFLEITRAADHDIAIPGHKASFGTVQLAQALGDLDTLAGRGRRVLRVHLKTGDIERLERLVAAAIQS